MKKLIVTLGLMLSANAWASPMDNICKVTWQIAFLHYSVIEENCERNMILQIEAIPNDLLMTHIAKYCRHDREINFHEHDDDGLSQNLACVLYSNRRREG